MATPHDFITVASEKRPQRSVTLKVYFHANDNEIRDRVNDIVHAVESGLGESPVRKFAYVEAIVMDTDEAA